MHARRLENVADTVFAAHYNAGVELCPGAAGGAALRFRLLQAAKLFRYYNRPFES